MFTGLIEDVGTVAEVEAGTDGARLRVTTRLAADLTPGDSVCVNGVCLTAADTDRAGFAVDAMNQTLRETALGSLQPGERVNLELASRLGDRLGGHLVQGHVDGTAEVLETEDDGFARRMRIELDPRFAQLVVDRGSIALDGVSLTVSNLDQGWLEVSLVPETLQRTTLGEAVPGRTVNVELDLIGKYVQRLMAPFGTATKD